jgi:hypothetical protein
MLKDAPVVAILPAGKNSEPSSSTRRSWVFAWPICQRPRTLAFECGDEMQPFLLD